MPIGRNSFIQITKLSNVKGRITYISSHAKQENLYAVYETTDRTFWNELAKCNQEEFEKSGTEGKCIEARELIIALPENFVEYDPALLLEVLTEKFHEKYGVECISALHHNKAKTNYHIHLIFSERRKLGEPVIKTATRNMFYDETGKHVRTKKEICNENGKIRDGCIVIKKGEVYEKKFFTKKDPQFKSENFLDEAKRFYTDQINRFVKDEKEKLQVYDRNGVNLPTKKIGKNNPKAEEIKHDNELRKEWNHLADRALAAGAEKEEILSIKEEQITRPIFESIKKYGIRPNRFVEILQKAIRQLMGLIQLLHELKSSVQSKNENQILRAQSKSEHKEEMWYSGKRPTSIAEEAEVNRIQGILDKIRKQEKKIYAIERKGVSLEKEQKELGKKWFHGREKKELEIKIKENRKQLKKAKDTLDTLPNMYGYENVLNVKNALEISTRALQKVKAAQNQWDKQHQNAVQLQIAPMYIGQNDADTMAADKKSIRDRLRKKQQELAGQKKENRTSVKTRFGYMEL